MAKNQDDLRVRRTHKMVHTAFIDLVIEGGFDEVTCAEDSRTGHDQSGHLLSTFPGQI